MRILKRHLSNVVYRTMIRDTTLRHETGQTDHFRKPLDIGVSALAHL